MSDRILEMTLQGYCCSQMIMKLGLEYLGKDNPDLVTAMKGLCGGVKQGEICGSLSAAICFLYLWDKDEDKARALDLSHELTEWFQEVYGCVRCIEIIEGDVDKKPTICPPLIENTFLKLMDLVEDYE